MTENGKAPADSYTVVPVTVPAAPSPPTPHDET